MDQVKQFHNDFVTKYKKQCQQIRKDPFRNVLKSMKFWMPCILNYIDFRNRFDIKVTNAFAECANRKIKQTYDAANGCSFDVLRAKVIFGNFLKENLPAHPITTKKIYGIRRLKERPKRFVRNPKANLARLRKVRKDSDKTKGLLPDPMENSHWSARFASSEPVKQESATGSLFDPPEEKPNLLMYEVDKSKFHENKNNSRKKRKDKTDSEQGEPPLFEFF